MSNWSCRIRTDSRTEKNNLRYNDQLVLKYLIKWKNLTYIRNSEISKKKKKGETQSHSGIEYTNGWKSETEKYLKATK